MKKLLRPKDVLLLGLGGIFDIFEEIRDPFGFRAESCEFLYGFVPENYKRHNFYHLIWRSLKTEEIEKILKDGEIYLRLTSKGKEKVTRDFPLLSLFKKPWDRKWRIVIFDIEEKSRQIRDQFRYKLKELGFGMLQKSVWITPHDILTDFSEFLENKNLQDVVFVFESRSNIVGNFKELANKVWLLDKLNLEYQKLYDNLISIHDREENLNKIRESFMNILLRDPFLPRELLPEDWVREALWKKLK